MFQPLTTLNWISRGDWMDGMKQGRKETISEQSALLGYHGALIIYFGEGRDLFLEKCE